MAPGYRVALAPGEERIVLAPPLATVERALVELGYVNVPEELLESDYEGPSALEHFAARPTWWTRFIGSM